MKRNLFYLKRTWNSTILNEENVENLYSSFFQLKKTMQNSYCNLTKKHCLYLAKTMISSHMFFKAIKSIHGMSKVALLWMMFCSSEEYCANILDFGLKAQRKYVPQEPDQLIRVLRLQNWICQV